MILGSTGQVLARLLGAEDGELFGASFAVVGDVLAVGAPYTRDPTGAPVGAVHFFRLADPEPELLDVALGEPGDRLGTDLAVFDGAWPPIFVAGAPGASQGAGALVGVRPGEGTLRRIGSAVPDAAMSSVVVARTRQGRRVLVAGSRSGYGGDGVVQFFRPTGRRMAVLRGAGGEGLGAAVAHDSGALGLGRVAVGAPDRRGGGAVHLVRLNGHVEQTLVYWGDRVGSLLSTPGDTNGDGRSELWVGMNAGGAISAVPWTLAP